jgi:hypothetical protein
VGRDEGRERAQAAAAKAHARAHHLRAGGKEEKGGRSRQRKASERKRRQRAADKRSVNVLELGCARWHAYHGVPQGRRRQRVKRKDHPDGVEDLKDDRQPVDLRRK